MATGYRPSSRGGSFKNRNIGDAGLSELRRRDQQVLDSMRQERNDYAEIHGNQIAGLRRVHNTEEQNRAEIKALDNKVYETKRANVAKRGDLEYQALMGKAKEYGKQSAMWQALTPTLAGTLSQTASNLAEQAEARRVAQAHKDGVESRKFWSEVAAEGVKAADLDAMVEAREAREEGNLGKALNILRKSPRNSVGVHNVHANRITSLIDDDLQVYLNSLQRDGVTVDSTNVDLHIENFRAINIKLNGWENSLAQGVAKWNEALSSKGSAMKRSLVRSENKREGDRQFSEQFKIVKDSPEGLTQHNIDRLVETNMNVLDEQGKLPNPAEAIRNVFGELARDTTIPIEEVYAALDHLTPEHGRNEKYPTYGKRDAGLRDYIREERANAGDAEVKLKEKERKFADLQETGKFKQWLSNTGIYGEGGEKAGQGWGGTREERTQAHAWAKQNGFTKTAELIESYSPYDESTYTKGLQFDYIKDLYDAGEWEKASNILENSLLFTNEDRNNAKAKFMPELGQFATLGTNEKKIDKKLEGLLKDEILKEWTGVRSAKDIPSLKDTITKGRVHLINAYKDAKKQYTNDEEGWSKALKQAWGETKDIITSRSDWAQIETADESDTGEANFSMQQPRSNPDEPTTAKARDLIATSVDPWGTQEILTTRTLEQIALNISKGLPVDVPELVIEQSLLRKPPVPVHVLINSQLAQTRKSGKGKEIQFEQRMQPGAKDIALLGTFPGYLNVQDRIAKAQGKFEAQALNNFVQTGGRTLENTRTDVRPIITTAPQFTPITKQFFSNEEVGRKWSEILSVCQGCQLEDISDISKNETKFKLRPGSYSYRQLVEKGASLGIPYNSQFGYFIVDED